MASEMAIWKGMSTREKRITNETPSRNDGSVKALT